MGEYCSVRVWQVKTGASTAEIEALAASGVAEMYRWIPGVKKLSLLRLAGEPQARYLLITTFVDDDAYKYWRQVEEEGPDYWERYASVFMHWGQLVHLVQAYDGQVIPILE